MMPPFILTIVSTLRSPGKSSTSRFDGLEDVAHTDVERGECQLQAEFGFFRDGDLTVIREDDEQCVVHHVASFELFQQYSPTSPSTVFVK